MAGVGRREDDPGAGRRRRPIANPSRTAPGPERPDDRRSHRRASRSMTRSVDRPSRWAKWRRGERPRPCPARVVAPDDVEQLGEGPDDPARDEGLERDVEVAAGDVLVEVVGEEQHRPAEGRELEHDRRIVGDQEVDGEQQVVELDRGGGPDVAVADASTIRSRSARDVERVAHERVHPDEADGVALDAQRVERLDVDPRRSRTRPSRRRGRGRSGRTGSPIGRRSPGTPRRGVPATRRDGRGRSSGPCAGSRSRARCNSGIPKASA